MTFRVGQLVRVRDVWDGALPSLVGRIGRISAVRTHWGEAGATIDVWGLPRGRWVPTGALDPFEPPPREAKP